MTPNEYLNAVLSDQTLSQDDEELDDLRAERSDIEDLLRGEYGSTPSIRYGGSYKKKTMMKASFDLDILCYFPREDGSAGDTLEDIYNSVADTLRGNYIVETKRSALRLLDPDSEHYAHVDVVPGRFVEGSDGDVNLYQKGGQKDSLKTNPEKHINHIRESSVRDVIKLTKLWNVKNYLGAKTFVLELLVVDVLEEEDGIVSDQVIYLFEALRDYIDGTSVEDPANPEGNDLSDMFDSATKRTLSGAARRALNQIENENWEAIFGHVENNEGADRSESLKSASAAATGSSKPWSYE
jgi:hypothetical protein